MKLGGDGFGSHLGVVGTGGGDAPFVAREVSAAFRRTDEVITMPTATSTIPEGQQTGSTAPAAPHPHQKLVKQIIDFWCQTEVCFVSAKVENNSFDDATSSNPVDKSVTQNCYIVTKILFYLITQLS